MATTQEYIEQLKIDKQNLVDNLVAKGVNATSNETFTSLVPKVNDIQTGGDISEYFTETISSGTSSISGYINTFKKFPPITNSGTSCAYMFKGFIGTEIDLSKFDTSNVTEMRDMFAYSHITDLDLRHFDVSKVTRMSDMFSGSSLININLSGWNLLSLTNMQSMFNNNRQLENVNLSGWNIHKGVNMNSLFATCLSLKRVDLSSISTPTGTTTGYMFQNDYALEYIDIRNFEFSNIGTKTDMFTGVPANCEIIVKDDTNRNAVLSIRSDLTNVKTVAELEA